MTKINILVVYLKDEIKLRKKGERKMKITRNYINRNYSYTLKCNYGWLNDLTLYNQLVGYNYNHEGWLYDAFNLGGGVCLVTGRNTSGVKGVEIPYKICKKYNDIAKTAKTLYCRGKITNQELFDTLFEYQTKLINEIMKCYIKD